MPNTGSWEICGLAHEAPDLLLVWVAHHLDLGATRLSLFLDRPNPRVSAALKEHPRVRVTDCTDWFWMRRARGRPNSPEVRQRTVLQHALDTSRGDWVLHLAMDEFLDTSRDVAHALASQPDHVDFVSLRALERVHVAPPESGSVFDGMFRKQNGVGKQAAVDSADGAAAPCLSRGMSAYAAGRSALRTGRKLVAGLHGPSAADKSRAGHMADIDLLHYDGLTPKHWVAKRLRALAQSAGNGPRDTPARKAQLAELGRLQSANEDLSALYTSLKYLPPDRAEALSGLGLLRQKPFDPRPALSRELPDVAVDLSAATLDAYDILPKGSLPPLPAPIARRTLQPRALDTLPQVSRTQILTCTTDSLHLPDVGGPRQTDWLDPFGAPYLLVLHNAVYYPKGTIATAADPVPLPRQKQRKDLGLLVASDGALYPDSFGKGRFVPGSIGHGSDGDWAAALPEPADTLGGTYLFAELVYAHFGHCLVDMPSRLWPLTEGAVAPDQLDGFLAMGMLGVGPRGKNMPGFATTLLEAYGVPREMLTVADRPVRIERLIVPRRIAPYMGLMHPLFGDVLDRAGDNLTRGAPAAEYPNRVFLSRARLDNDPRSGGDLQALEDIFTRRGFTARHPQDMSLADQVRMAQNATHFAGPIGSQMHLCGFCRKPEAKVFTLAPENFKIQINSQLLQRVGGSETFFFVEQEAQDGPVHRAKWAVRKDDFPRLEAALDAWLQNE